MTDLKPGDIVMVTLSCSDYADCLGIVEGIGKVPSIRFHFPNFVRPLYSIATTHLRKVGSLNVDDEPKTELNINLLEWLQERMLKLEQRQNLSDIEFRVVKIEQRLTALEQKQFSLPMPSVVPPQPDIRKDTHPCKPKYPDRKDHYIVCENKEQKQS